MGSEIMFYNGFNLLIDLILCTIVGVLTYRWTRSSQWMEGFNKATTWIENGVLFQEECDGQMKWSVDFSRCICDCCTDTPDNVTQLFSHREAD